MIRLPKISLEFLFTASESLRQAYSECRRLQTKTLR